MRITSHFLDQAQRGSVPQAMIDALREVDFPANSAIVLGEVPSTHATAIAILRQDRRDKHQIVAATCLTRYRAFSGPEVLKVDRVFELKK